MDESATVSKLREFAKNLHNYDALYTRYGRSRDTLGERSVLTKMADLRPILARQYGELRGAIAETLGGEPEVQTGYRNFGNAFLIVLSDPVGNPALATAIEGAIGCVEMAVGDHAGRADQPKTLAAQSVTLRLHPRVEAACSKLLNDMHYPQAVFEASKALMQLVRDKTGLTSDGAQLVESALSPKAPMLAVNKLETEAERDEQRGILHLAQGVVYAIRHQGAHVAGQREERDRAFEMLGIISYLARRIEEATRLTPRGD
ncbi:MAG: TIGR02391 family protein [Actinomycetota bacterium]|nr:TIGR02391 family protein [Actinomycetota bacterium]